MNIENCSLTDNIQNSLAHKLRTKGTTVEVMLAAAEELDKHKALLGRILGEVECAYTAPSLPVMDAYLDRIRNMIIDHMAFGDDLK